MYNINDKVIVKENCPFSEYRGLNALVKDQSKEYVQVELLTDKFSNNLIWLLPEEIETNESI
jgi:hypothetical protein